MTIPLGNSLRMRSNLQVQSLMFPSWVFLSTEKAYSSFPRLQNLELILFINTLLLHGLNPRPSLYNISAKNHLNCFKNLLFESLFLWVLAEFSSPFFVGAIFLISGFYLTINNYVFDHSNFPNIMSPGIRVKHQRLKPLRKSLNVSRAKFDVRDFWTWELRANLEKSYSRSTEKPFFSKHWLFSEKKNVPAIKTSLLWKKPPTTCSLPRKIIRFWSKERHSHQRKARERGLLKIFFQMYKWSGKLPISYLFYALRKLS